MWAEIPMFRSFEKSVYTSYLHLRGEAIKMGERCAAPLARPSDGPAWTPLDSNPPRVAFISRERATGAETRAVHPHPRRRARATSHNPLALRNPPRDALRYARPPKASPVLAPG